MNTSMDRVQAHTAEHINQQIHEDARKRVFAASGESQTQLSERIQKLEKEWDIERWLEMNASALAMTGTVLGLL